MNTNGNQEYIISQSGDLSYQFTYHISKENKLINTTYIQTVNVYQSERFYQTDFNMKSNCQLQQIQNIINEQGIKYWLP